MTSPWYELDGVRLASQDGPTVRAFVQTFTPGSVEHRTQDHDNPVGDGLHFGRDLVKPPLWAWELLVYRPGLEQEAADDLAALAGAWSADAVRQSPGAVQSLRYHRAGRTRRVFGRARRFSPVPARMRLGRIPVVCDFQLADHLHYGDVEESVTRGLVPATVGGLLAPLSSPLSTLTEAGPRIGQFVVDGDAPTWARVVFRGPVSNPWAQVAGWRVQLSGSIAYDRSVTVDARPWVRTVRRSDGAYVGGMLTRASRMDRMLLPPGQHEVAFGGIDDTNTATTSLLWRPAWRGL